MKFVNCGDYRAAIFSGTGSGADCAEHDQAEDPCADYARRSGKTGPGSHSGAGPSGCDSSCCRQNRSCKGSCYSPPHGHYGHFQIRR